MFCEKLITQIKLKGNPCVVGIDPRIEGIPEIFFKQNLGSKYVNNNIQALESFCISIVDSIKDIIPIVKINSAFFESEGIEGLKVFVKIKNYALENGLIVIGDVKRGDIASTNENYAKAYLEDDIDIQRENSFTCDAITAPMYFGLDGTEPFIKRCKEFNRGIFFLIKTSNKGSRDYQDQYLLGTNRPLYEKMAFDVIKLNEGLVGDNGYSSIGVVVGATFPEQAKELRNILPYNYFLVPGYGAQGGKAIDLINYFNRDGFGAIVNSSRGIIHSNYNLDITLDGFKSIIRKNTLEMIEQVSWAVGESQKI